MSAGYEAFFLARIFFYIFRLLLSLVYGVLRFISKPGSRKIMPVLVGGFLFLVWMVVRGQVSDPILAAVMLFAIFLIFTIAYVIVSRVLALVLGTLPVVTKPLAPMRRLRPKQQVISSAVVKIVVPPLTRSPRVATAKEEAAPALAETASHSLAQPSSPAVARRYTATLR